MLEVYQIGRLVAEVVSTQAVEHEADPLLQLAYFVGLHVLHYFVGSILDNNNKEKCEQPSSERGSLSTAFNQHRWRYSPMHQTEWTPVLCRLSKPIHSV